MLIDIIEIIIIKENIIYVGVCARNEQEYGTNFHTKRGLIFN